MRRRAIIYGRISSDPGHDERGVARQVKRGQRVCAQFGWDDPLILIDNDTSATSGVFRESYSRVLELVDADGGEFCAVWAWGQDRFCRDPGEWEVFMKIAKHRKILFGDRDGIRDLSKAGDRYAARSKGNAAAYEVENMKERQQEAFDQLVEDGLAFWSHRPFGYTMPVITKFDRTPPEIVENEAALIRQAYYDLLEGRALNAIAREWNQKGVRTPTRQVSAAALAKRKGAGGGNLWRGANLRALLLSPRNAGIRERVRTETVKGTARVVSREVFLDVQTEWKPIIERDIWEGVVAKLTSRKANHVNGYSRKYLMSGLALCGNCGEKVASGIRPGQKPAYICRHCFKVKRSVERVDKFIDAMVINYLTDQDIERKMSGGVDTAKLRARLIELDGAEAELGEALGAGMKFAIIKPQLDAIKAERAEIDATLQAQPHQLKPLEQLLKADDIAQAFGAMPLDRKRAVIALLFTVTILPGQPGGNAPFDPTYVRLEPNLDR